MAMPLLEAIAPAKRLLADKAYDADRLRNWLGDRRIEAVIPGRNPKCRLSPQPHGLPASKCHRAHVREAQKLEMHRRALRQARCKPARSHHPRHFCDAMAHMSPPT
ncbi:hypothetical protein BOSEA31B_12611 [Hyphomicrobiales bacterium]|nr:hypothetical protein BOSEA31B_12611 [Hyphomicrobiales bacterium]CAH1698380.1 hypothetical protein BOSEA1005_11433 [Hyphomicrobiales bacterium]CAI0342033.1 hypothetical protein BO1005MUT1_160012 [Hyphomicrobiales bacterium]